MGRWCKVDEGMRNVAAQPDGMNVGDGRTCYVNIGLGRSSL